MLPDHGLTDSSQASRYLLDPLTAPEPNAETGPGTHYNSTYSPQTTTSARSERNQNTPSTSVRSSSPLSAQKFTPSATSNNPYRNGSTSYPSPPRSASSRSGRFSGHRPDVIPASEASSQIPTSTGGGASTTTGGHRHRTSSLNQRFSGDQSHRPLDMIMQDAKHAHRHPNLRKRNQVGADSIDLLDNITRYHHEGPFDATLLARNQSYANSPVEAVRTSNEEALRATPKEMIKDSIDKHRPLDGVAMVPPGMEDRDGNVYNYNEGTNMMIENGPEGGAYKRWPGVVCIVQPNAPVIK